MKQKFKDIRFSAKSLKLIETANAIIADYAAQGYQLTLRQLYYQFVSKAAIENTERSYKNLGGVINDGRMAGLIDWSAIEDRTRNLKDRSHWESPSEIVRGCASQFYKDHWANQDYRIEVWVEKEALAGVAEAACRPLDVPFFCCKGYTSQSEMYAASQRLLRYRDEEEQRAVIIHLGDHDPSGIDMSRDIIDRLTIFTEEQDIVFKRIALNLDQIHEYNPPPNPAKMTDSRFVGYRRNFGSKSWELDALEPRVLVQLITDKINEFRDLSRWSEVERNQAEAREQLSSVARTIENEE